MTVYFAGIDMPRAIEIRDRDKLHGMAEEVLSEDGEKMLRVLPIHRGQNQRCNNYSLYKEYRSPRPDSYSGPQFELYLKNSLRKQKLQTKKTSV